MKPIGNNKNVNPEYPTNHSVESHLLLTEITWKITETKTLMQIQGPRRERGPSQLKNLSLAYCKN